MASMRDWLKGSGGEKEHVVVVHCKAGKGRSGTVACSYLISEEEWTVDDAMARFTARRMRPGFGNGISIPSQQRWIKYVDWWTKHGKVYVERQIEILEVHVWGLRDGVKVAIEGYVDQGRTIKTFHTFGKSERTLMGETTQPPPSSNGPSESANEKNPPLQEGKRQIDSFTTTDAPSPTIFKTNSDPNGSAALFRPSTPIILPTSDINIDFERRNRATYGFTMVTSVAHVWFNTFFESQRSSPSPMSHSSTLDSTSLPTSGVFSIPWDAMDGIKGSARKGTRALDHLSVVWRAVTPSHPDLTKIITQPAPNEYIPDTGAADWRKAHQDSPTSLGKDLGLRTESPGSASVSKANSVKSDNASAPNPAETDDGVRAHGPDGEDHISHVDYDPPPAISISESQSPEGFTPHGSYVDLGMEKVKSPSSMKDVGLGDTAAPVAGMGAAKEEDLPEAEQHVPGQLVKDDGLGLRD